MGNRNQVAGGIKKAGRARKLWAKMAEFSQEHRLLTGLGVASIIVVVVVIGWIWQESRSPQLSVTCRSITPATSYDAKPYEENPESQFLLVDQIIVTGPTSAVTDVVYSPDLTLPNGRALTKALTLTGYCDLNYQNSHNLDLESFPFPSKALSDLTMRLYEVPKEQPIAEVVNLINDAGSDRYVFADPNYLTGPLTGASACGNPTHAGGGSPFAGISPTSTTAEWFWRQWAFEHVGAGPAFQDALHSSSINPTGKDVLVGVFDTSPFTPVSATATVDSEGGKHFSESVTQMSPILRLSVSHPKMRDLEATYPATATNVNDHGLFVAGLIHAIAPESEIRLIRVLNEYGCGDLFTLNKALYHFIADMEAERKGLDGTVINLSLGVLKPVSNDVVIRNTEHETITVDSSLQVLVDDTLESLQAAVLLAHSRGAVVVAAAGNDSGALDIGDKPLPPQIPARYPFVIGVAGSNAARERACFSNWGDVSAPGGDSRSEEGPDYCEREVLVECSGDCDEAVISLALGPSTTGTSQNDIRYAYWRGTSFSAPLVSGLAALVLDAGASKSTCPLMSPTWVHPDQVIDAIRCGTSTGDGVINVPATLFRCMP